MRRDQGGVLYSPHDVIAFLEGDYVAWMGRLYFELHDKPSLKHDPQLNGIDIKKDADDPEMELVKKKGFAHEEAYLKQLKEQTQVCQIPDQHGAWAATLAAMKAAKAVIVQGELRHDQFSGRPDFLVRVDGESRLGEHHYLARDTKLARRVRPEHVVQLCAYAQMLLGIQGVRPVSIEFVLGTGELASLSTAKFCYYFLRLRDAFLRFQQQFDPKVMPNVGLQRELGHWSAVAEQILERSDHISRTARITIHQIKHLEAAGVRTMKQLAQRSKPVPKLSSDTLDRLRRQAALQLKSASQPKPAYEVLPHVPVQRRGLALLPLADPADIFFDMEGFPMAEDGLEYLFGAVVQDKKQPKLPVQLKFHDWWAHDAIQERQAFEQFVDWAHARWSKHPNLHIYHYAAYETAALRRLMGKYASREAKVDDLLRNQVFVDLYTLVRQGVMIGTAGYSLKDIEPLFAPPRQGSVKTASGSVVAYQAWLDAGEPQDWQKSPILTEIRDYNRVDCESLVYLRDWLAKRQAEAGIDYAAKGDPSEEPQTKSVEPRSSTLLAEQMLSEVAAGQVVDPERRRLQALLAWLLEFHWRESKPVFWRKFDRHAMETEQLVDDIDCLGDLTLISEDDGWYTFIFDPEQETKLDEGSACFYAHDLQSRCTIKKIDLTAGRVTISLGNNTPPPPKKLNLIPNEFVDPKMIAEAVERFVTAWHGGQACSQAVRDLLHRRPPRIKGHSGGRLIDPKKPTLKQLIDLVQRLDRTTLCIQGPPGCGKTYSSGEVIAALLADGKRVGVTAQSHKAIINVLKAVAEASVRRGIEPDLYKVGGDKKDPDLAALPVQPVDSKNGEGICQQSGSLAIGGTAWFFSRAKMTDTLDYLFIDEAGQFSLANVVAVGQAATNMVLVGDQMQLSQPLQGTHPGDSGRSGLEYLLDGKATIPPDFGVLLDQTFRLHPTLCQLVSDMTYDGRLKAHESTAQRYLLPSSKAALLDRGSGIQFVPVLHEGNGQCSDEEITKIQELIIDLRASRLVDKGKGINRKLTHDDILLIAPYNMQVARLRKCLGDQVRIGSVDKFQGQEAPVAILSMCASSLDDCPRGAEFLFDPNRLNVAISRAQCLAIVVACPTLLAPRCTSLRQMELVNAFCRIEDYAAQIQSKTGKYRAQAKATVE